MLSMVINGRIFPLAKKLPRVTLDQVIPSCDSNAQPTELIRQ